MNEQSCGKCAFWNRKLDDIGVPSSYGVCQYRVGVPLPEAYEACDMNEDEGKHCQVFCVTRLKK